LYKRLISVTYQRDIMNRDTFKRRKRGHCVNSPVEQPHFPSDATILGNYIGPRDIYRVIDVKFNEYDFQMILDFLYLLPLHSFLFETKWLLEVLTNWLFGLQKTENVVKTDKRYRTDNMVIMYDVANEYPKYKSHKYNIHFMLDSDDTSRKYLEIALKTSYETYLRLLFDERKERHTLDVYCIVAREPAFTLYYPTEKTIPHKYKKFFKDL